MWTCHGCMQSWKHSHWLENHLAASPWCRARAVNAPPPPAGPAPAPAGSEDDSGDDAGFFGNSSGDDADMDYAGDAGHLPRASQDGSGDDTKSDGGSLDGGGGGGSSGGSDMSEDLPAGLSYRILHAQNQAAARGAAAAQRTEALPMSRRDVEMSLSLFRLEHELSHAAIDDLVELCVRSRTFLSRAASPAHYCTVSPPLSSLRNNPEHLHRIRKSRTCYDDFSNEGRGAVDIVSLHVDVRRIGDPTPVPFKYETRTVEDGLVDLFTRPIIKDQSSWPDSHKCVAPRAPELLSSIGPPSQSTPPQVPRGVRGPRRGGARGPRVLRHLQQRLAPRHRDLLPRGRPAQAGHGRRHGVRRPADRGLPGRGRRCTPPPVRGEDAAAVAATCYSYCSSSCCCCSCCCYGLYDFLYDYDYHYSYSTTTTTPTPTTTTTTPN